MRLTGNSKHVFEDKWAEKCLPHSLHEKKETVSRTILYLSSINHVKSDKSSRQSDLLGC